MLLKDSASDWLRCGGIFTWRKSVASIKENLNFFAQIRSYLLWLVPTQPTYLLLRFLEH